MDARRFNDTRGLANLTLKELIDWYFEEIGTAHPFGKNKTAVLRTWQPNHGDLSVTKRLATIRCCHAEISMRKLQRLIMATNAPASYQLRSREMGWVIGIAVVVLICAAISDAASKKKLLNALDASLRSRTDFTLSQHVVGCDLKTGIALDESRGKLCLMTRSGAQFTLRMIEMRDIVSAELFQDGDSVTKTMRSSQLGGALIGGLAFGGVGAIVGGLSGQTRTSTKIKQIALRIVANDPSSPLHDITFMNTEQKKDGIVYTAAMKNARHWHGILEILIKRADVEMKASQPAAAAPQAAATVALAGSVADELEKLASLRNAGILTDDEFNTQKSKLLARA